MAENLKRFRIEFTVDVHHEGVTKDWDWSNDEIKHFALQELECMSPYPFDITFSEIDSPWHTSTPTEKGAYLIKLESQDGEVSYTIMPMESVICGNKLYMKNNELSIVGWQKIEDDEDG